MPSGLSPRRCLSVLSDTGLLRNKYNVLDVLREHIHQLQIMRRMIERDDAEGLTGAFGKANSIQRIIH